DKLVPVKFWRFFWGREKLGEKTNGFSGGTVYSFNFLPFGGFVRLYGEDEAAADMADGKAGKREEKGFNNETAWKKALVVIAGVFMNVVLGWLLLSSVFMIGVPKHLMIAEVAPVSPAFSAGLKAGDVILGLKAGNVSLSDPISADDFTKIIRSGETYVNLEIERGSENLSFRMEPRKNPPEGQGPLGVNIVEVGLKSQPFFQGLSSGLSGVWGTTKMVIEGLGLFIGQIFTSPGAIQNVAGPVGIVVLAAQATSLGFVYFIQLLALISINLAVLNLLPFPALDGGRFLFIIIEKLRGAPVSRRFQIWVNSAGFAVLILLLIFVTVKDIGRLF
ncbi:RIP metalloprotease RseP, partial [bacterium]